MSAHASGCRCADCIDAENRVILDAQFGASGQPLAVSGDASEPIMINGKPATALSLLDALIDIYKDQRDAPPESRCYVESAWSETVADAEKFLASQASPAKRGAEPSDFLEVLDVEDESGINTHYSRELVLECIEAALAQSAPSEKLAGAVYLVATGEVVDGKETYTRHEGSPPPLSDYEKLYPSSHAQTVPQVPAGQDSEPDLADIIAGSLGTSRAHAYKLMRERVASLQPEAAGAAQPSEADRYWTQPGESIMGIALRQLKDESRWSEIRDLNASSFPDMGPHDYYPVGTALRMPARTPTDAGGKA